LKPIIQIGLLAITASTLIFSRCHPYQSINILGEIQHPSDNPFSAKKAELGRQLFFDKRLSRDSSISCATCHVPKYAFTDRKRFSNGVGGGVTERNAPSLLNAGYLKTAMFDAHLSSLELQVIVPIQEHVEMDMNMVDLIRRLKNIPEYQKAALSIFNRDFDAFVLTRSIAAFERTLISSNSRFDQFYYGKDLKALNDDEKEGWKLFSEKLYCTKCHPAPYFTNFIADNNGLYVDYGKDQGRFRIFGDTSDIGKFKVPTLRNIALTYPYMHDGSISSIEEVIDHYSKGGKGHVNQSSILKPFNLSDLEIKQLKAFLFSLTDTSYMTDFN
jgi:cytochrome c peroxidase